MKSIIFYVLCVILLYGGLIHAEVLYEIIPIKTSTSIMEYAKSINNYGEIAGSKWTDTDSVHASSYNYRANDIIKDLGTLGGYHSEAYSINVNGQIVGYAATRINDYPLNPSDSACLFDTTGNGNNVLLDNSFSRAYSINDNGQIVGFYKNNNDPHACIFDSSGNGNTLDLGTLGGSRSYANSINNNNQIVT